MRKLSVIITAHSEGLLAHKTMRAIFEGLAPFDQKRIPYEIIIHIDNGTPETKDYFKRYESQKCCKIYNNNFKDPGLSRNFAISKATGDIVTLIDADDLLSSSWLETAYDLVCKHKESVIVHPFACLTFGINVDPVLNFYGPSLSPAEDATVLIGENRWGSVVMAPKTIFTAHPYIASKNGYGHEDYYFSTETVADKIKHIIAPETVLFYRRGNQSILDSNNATGALQPYSRLFDQVHPTGPSNFSATTKSSRRPALYQKLQHLYHTSFRHLPGRELIKKALQHSAPQPRQFTPEEEIVIREWRKINHIETLLCPTRSRLAKLTRYSEFQNIDCGLKYYELMGKIAKKPSYIFLVPWLSTGGADKVVINYAEAMQKLQPAARMMIITTEPSDNQFRQLLPENVDFIDFGNAAVDLHPILKDRLLSRIIVQSQCQKVHIVNSDYAYLWAKNHLAFAKTLDLRLSIFCTEYVPGMQGECFFDYADMYLPLLAPAVKHIYTDNATIVKCLVEQCGISESLCEVHYQPVSTAIIQPAHTVSHPKTRILWASRVCPTKRPELLCAIARQLDPKAFSIEAYGTIEEPYSRKLFAGIPALKYRGAYQGIASLDVSQYDVFLYTSMNDGIPNVILEMAALGLPIIASNVGGVSEVIKNGETGTLPAKNDAASFIKELERLHRNYAPYSKMAQSAQALLRAQHSSATFLDSVKGMLK